jgi:hypothetical protein
VLQRKWSRCEHIASVSKKEHVHDGRVIVRRGARLIEVERLMQNDEHLNSGSRTGTLLGSRVKFLDRYSDHFGLLWFQILVP